MTTSDCRWNSMNAIRKDIEAVVTRIDAGRGLAGGLDSGDLDDVRGRLVDALADIKAEMDALVEADRPRRPWRGFRMTPVPAE